jgi:hypothetical protein
VKIGNRSSKILLLLLFCAALMAVNAAGVAAGSDADEPVWAQSVVSFKMGAGDVGVNFSDPEEALGPVDAKNVALGNAQTPSPPPANPASCEAVLILSFGKYSIVDGEGDDLTIYESAAGGLLEPTWVYIGGAGDWRYVGETAGGKDSLDISGVAGPDDSFNQVAICDIPDGDTTIWPAPGPDIDAVSANNSAELALIAQAQGPGWSVDLDPTGTSRSLFMPMPELKDLTIQPPAVFKFECPAGEPLDDCLAFLIIRAQCGGSLNLIPAFYIYPLPQPTLRDLIGGYKTEHLDQLAGYCQDKPGRTAVTATDPISVFTLQEGGARFKAATETWRFELQTPLASLYSAGKNDFNAIHDPQADKTTVWVLGGSLEVEPTAAGAGPVTVNGGQKATITDEGLQSVSDLDQVFMPAAMHLGS